MASRQTTVPNSLACDSLEDQEVLQHLRSFREMVESCYGPSGRLKLLQSRPGSHVVVTSTSSILLDRLALNSHPVLKLLMAAVQGHLAAYSDAGLFAAILATNLLERGLRNDSLNRPLCARAYRAFGRLCADYLESADCACARPVDVGDSRLMMSVVRACLASKPLCRRTRRDTDLLASLILQVFLRTLPDDSGASPDGFDRVSYLYVTGPDVKESRVKGGLMFEVPEVSLAGSLRPQRGSDGAIRSVVFNCSLSGDSEDIPDLNYESPCGVTSANPYVLERILVLARHLVSQGVGFLGCQKVVHPTAKKFFRQNSIIVLDRLGLTHIGLLQQLCGANLLSSFLVSTSEKDYGYLDDITETCLYSKSYIHLSRSKAHILTFVLCHNTDYALEELKVTCKTALHILRMLLGKTCTMLCGGGCTEVNLAAHLRRRVGLTADKLMSELSCSRSQLLSALQDFVSTLESMAALLNPSQGMHVTGQSNKHHWIVAEEELGQELMAGQPCLCGMTRFLPNDQWKPIGIYASMLDAALSAESISEDILLADFAPDLDSLVLDPMQAKINALKVAVETSGMILTLNYTIHENDY